MTTQYFCKNQRRRDIVRTTKDGNGNPILNGIDYLEIDSENPSQKTLNVYFIHNLPGQTNGVPAGPNLKCENITISGGVRVQNIKVESVEANENILTVQVDSAGDFSQYILRVVNIGSKTDPPDGFDPLLSEVMFSFKAGCPSEFDCQGETKCPTEAKGTEPAIDYLAKDYASFRRLILDRLSVIMPDWQERNPADLGNALVDLLAYAGDYLSYYQDAVATEAYLGTARKRVSVRRHARLLDYFMHEGCNARAWVQFQVRVDELDLEQGTQLLTRVAGLPTHIYPDSSEYDRALSQQPVVFETMHDAKLYKARNEIYLYTWGDEKCCLPKGATRATLHNTNGNLNQENLRPGHVLIFEEVRDPANGNQADADPAHRHPVRLTNVLFKEDKLFHENNDPNKPCLQVVDIEWSSEDGLPFPLCLWEVIDPDYPEAGVQPVSVARGNVVLADFGRTIEREELEEVPSRGRYSPSLQNRFITSMEPYDHEQAQTYPATAIIKQNPRNALPVVTLFEDNNVWIAQRNLLNSDRFAREFVVEIDEDRRASIRFGDDVLGKRPTVGSDFTAKYRVGTGQAGNVGADSIVHVVTVKDGIVGVRNPLSAQGDTDPESMEQVQLYAPYAFRSQERAVTEADYAVVAQRHPEVQKAQATRRWTGSWHTMFITVDRKGGLPVDTEFEIELSTFVNRYRLAGHDVEIEPPRFVPLDIALKVCVAPGYYRSDVKEALLAIFSNQDLPDGSRGFFHPDQFTFGQPIYLSQIVSAAMKVTGVRWVDVVRFHRWGALPLDELEQGMINFGKLEIARLDNDPNAPENGKIEFIMEGGL